MFRFSGSAVLLTTETGRSFALISMKGVNLMVFVRSFLLETLWNHQKMQNVGFVFCLYPALRKIFGSDEERKSVVLKNLDAVNTHPSMGPLLVGVTARLELELDPLVASQYRKRIMAALASQGDYIFWGHVKPLAAIIGAIVTLLFFGSSAGGLTAIVVYNIPNMWFRATGFSKGWRNGLNGVQSLRSPAVDKMIAMMKILFSAGLGVLTGLLLFRAFNMVLRAENSHAQLWVGISFIVAAALGFVVGRNKGSIGALIHLVPLAIVVVLILVEAGTSH